MSHVSTEERLYQVILSPIISEKSTMLGEKHNQVVFHVVDGATKKEVKLAVEKLFKVEVDSVQVLNQRGKVKRGRNPGQRKMKRKAFVRLKSGHDIDFAGGMV